MFFAVLTGLIHTLIIILFNSKGINQGVSVDIVRMLKVLTLKTTALILFFPCRYSTTLLTTEWRKLLKPFAPNSKIQATLTLPNKLLEPCNTQTRKMLILLRKFKELNTKMSRDQAPGGNGIYHGPNLDLEVERGVIHTRNIRNINLINTPPALGSIGTETETLYVVVVLCSHIITTVLLILLLLKNFILTCLM